MISEVPNEEKNKESSVNNSDHSVANRNFSINSVGTGGWFY